MILNSRKRRQLRRQHDKGVGLYRFWSAFTAGLKQPIAPGSIAKLESMRLPKPYSHQKVSAVMVGARAGMSRLPESNGGTSHAVYIPMLDVNWVRQSEKAYRRFKKLGGLSNGDK